MVESLDGIDRVILTINPETLEPERYHCAGARNFGTFSQGKLVDWYKPMSGRGEHHSSEYLILCSQMFKRPYEVKVKGEKGYE